MRHALYIVSIRVTRRLPVTYMPHMYIYIYISVKRNIVEKKVPAL